MSIRFTIFILGAVLFTSQCVTADGTYNIKRAGVFNVGGEVVEVNAANVTGDDSGTIFAQQLLISYFIPNTDSPRSPVIMIPGYGLSKDIYLETPDGREGWAMNFVRHGYPVYLVEPVNSARAGINPEALNGQIHGRTEAPSSLFTWTRELAWPRFGFGETYPVPFNDSQLAPGAYDDLTKMFTPIQVERVSGIRMLSEVVEENIEGIDQVIHRTGPAVLLVHSASGVPGFRYTNKNPDNILAVVNIEPVGCPSNTINEFPNVPVLSMFADHMEVRPQMPARLKQCQQVVEALKERGVKADMLDLPRMGIHGNSHLPMSELNSGELAGLIINWLEEL